MDCPRCAHTGLRDVRNIFVCLSCGGAFLPAAARDTVTMALDPTAQKTAALAGVRGQKEIDSGAAPRCPICRKDMQRFHVGAVAVDTCHDHGSWYDRGELDVVAETLRARIAAKKGNSAAEDVADFVANKS